jgi:uroporphyrinogen-III decarboxylase
MTSRERVLTALRTEQPDRVPYCEIGVDRALAHKLLGWDGTITEAANLEAQPYSIDEMNRVADHLHLDNIYYVLRAPVYAERIQGRDGRLFYGEGLIRSREDLGKLELPDPEDESLYDGAREYVAGKGDRAAFFVTRVGVFPTMLSMGTETFSVALYEDRAFLEEILDRYVDWTVAVADHACSLGFDVYVSTDDMAFKSAPYFSPAVFKEVMVPRYRRVAEKVSLPWIVHSDGNIIPFVDDFVELGVSGLHPNEKGATDIRDTKRRYGDKLCLLGNVDLNLLGADEPEAVDREVRRLIQDVAPGGGYIVTSGNSLAGYLIPENVTALSRAVRRYGDYANI